MYYSKSTGGFYPTEYPNSPTDLVEITEAHHKVLLDGESSGKHIVSDSNGYPILVEKTVSYAELCSYVTVCRELAYRQESDPLFFKSKRGECSDVEWLDKISEIKSRYPTPPVEGV